MAYGVSLRDMDTDTNVTAVLLTHRLHFSYTYNIA